MNHTLTKLSIVSLSSLTACVLGIYFAAEHGDKIDNFMSYYRNQVYLTWGIVAVLCVFGIWRLYKRVTE